MLIVGLPTNIVMQSKWKTITKILLVSFIEKRLALLIYFSRWSRIIWMTRPQNKLKNLKVNQGSSTRKKDKVYGLRTWLEWTIFEKTLDLKQISSLKHCLMKLVPLPIAPNLSRIVWAHVLVARLLKNLQRFFFKPWLPSRREKKIRHKEKFLVFW